MYQNPTFKEDGEFVSGISSAHAEKKLMVTTQKGEVAFNLAESSWKSAPVLYIYGIDGSLLSTRSLESGSTTVSLSAGTYVYGLCVDGANVEAGRFVLGR